MKKHSPFPAAFFAALPLLSGCEQSGDLYLPTDPETETAISSADETQPEPEKNSQDEDSQDQP